MEAFLDRVLLLILVGTQYSSEAAVQWFATCQGVQKKNRYLDKSVVTPTYVMCLFNTLSDEALESLFVGTREIDEHARRMADKFVVTWRAYKALEKANMTQGVACSSRDVLADLSGSLTPKGLVEAAGEREATNTSIQESAGRMRLNRLRKEFGMSYGKLPPREPLELERLRSKVAP